MNEAAALYRLLGDETRLRLLRVLAQERLNVSELTSVLALAQSGVSRHLGLLKDAGFVTESREGGFSYYRVSNELQNPPPRSDLRRGPAEAGAKADGPRPHLWDLLQSQFRANMGKTAARADEARLQEVLRLRKENFEVHGDESHQLVPGRSWAAWARALGLLIAPRDVADIGCGEGYLTLEAARWARKVIAIDASAEVLKRARALATRRNVTNVVWRRGQIEKLPLKSATVDVALLSQALHHAADPARAVSEAVRILRPGGRVLVLDLRLHDEAWVKERLGDRWLGFDDAKLRALLEGAGLTNVVVHVGARKAGDPFTVLIATGARDQGSGIRERRHDE